MAANSEVPVALTIAGSDSSAGAGAQADLKTFAALGVYGLNAITCVVAEMPGKVARIDGVAVESVRAQIEILLENFPVAAIKTGLLFSSEIVDQVAASLRAHARKINRQIPLVIDPVIVATSGELLLRENAIARYEQALFPLAALVTPNLDEAAKLLGEPIRDVAQMRKAGEKLSAKYGVPFLLKGGHLSGNTALDLLFAGNDVVEFSAPFLRGVSTHGTGCTYSAAIAVGLARGLKLQEAILAAKQFVTATIAQHFSWRGKKRTKIHALNHSATR